MPTKGSRIPIELWERIIDLASVSTTEGRYDEPEAESYVDYPTLLACALVCQAWLPRARHNLLSRVVVRSSRALKLFLTASQGSATVAHELELTLPLDIREEPRRRLLGGPVGASLASPDFARAVNKVTMLTLRDSEWLYPRTYFTIFGSSFTSLATLALYRTSFPTGGDLARLLWSLRALQHLECTEVMVRHGGVWSLPAPTKKLTPCEKVTTLMLNSCSSTTPFIIRAVTAASITYLYLRTSFARWRPDDFQVFAALVSLQRFDLVLASPMRLTDSPLPSQLGLLELYRQASHAIFSSLSAAGRRRATLRALNLTYEPGEGSWNVISGQKLEDGSSAVEEVPDDYWTYEQRRSSAVDVLLRGVEECLVTNETLHPSFARLRSFGILIWDTNEGKTDGWWYEEFSKGLPTLHALGVLRVEVLRSWTMDEAKLWDTES
ncbi:hypothetical protein C8Q74DRAFT_1263702 [Fomes fomentarius]|nr:hypothetical protein C8Q74DRAFT_1263702 [Fomes fomentarius]